MKHDPEMIERVARALSLEEEASENYWDAYTELAQAALDAAFQWRDIETAPRDGRIILGYFNEKYVETIQWGGEYWFWSHDGDAPNAKSQPTHWLPLPAPPEED